MPKLSCVFFVFSLLIFASSAQNRSDEDQIKINEEKIAEVKSSLQVQLASLDLNELLEEPHTTSVPVLNGQQATEMQHRNAERSREELEQQQILLDRDQEERHCLATHFIGFNPDVREWFRNLRINITNVGPVEVQCMNEYPYNSPWIMVLKRFNGQVDFDKTWDELKNGIGSLDSEFFFGLQNLHLLTTSRRYELRIYLRDFHNHHYNIFYNNFVVGSEDEGYAIRSLGKYLGNAEDCLKQNRNSFATYDTDNKLNCARLYGPWWQSVDNTCSITNLFVKDPLWGNNIKPTRVYMMIRPTCPYS